MKFPFSNHKGFKCRPTLIVSNNGINSKSPDAIAIAISTKKGGDEYTIDLHGKVNPPLRKRSYLRCTKIHVIEQKSFIKKIGELNKGDFNEVKKKINDML